MPARDSLKSSSASRTRTAAHTPLLTSNVRDMRDMPDVRALLGLTPEQRAALLAELTPQEAEALLYDWHGLWARPAQLPPPGEAWRTWLIMAGRGFGKTRSGAEWIR